MSPRRIAHRTVSTWWRENPREWTEWTDSQQETLTMRRCRQFVVKPFIVNPDAMATIRRVCTRNRHHSPRYPARLAQANSVTTTTAVAERTVGRRTITT